MRSDYGATNGYIKMLKDHPTMQGMLARRGFDTLDAFGEPLDPTDEYNSRKMGAADNYAEEMAERAETPRQTIYGREPITLKQQSYLASLIDKRGTDFDKSIDIDTLSKNDASRLIDTLLKQPIVITRMPVSTVVEIANAPTLPDVPAGRYAIVTEGITKFYVYKRPTEGRWAHYTFLKAQASDELHDIRNLSTKVAVLTEIAKDVQGARERYGRELGSCYQCGRTLTDETSRELGIGPDCRSKGLMA